MTYINEGNARGGCIFCELPPQKRDAENLILFQGQHAFVILNRFPYVSGHLMVVPYRHVSTPVVLLPEEWAEMGALVRKAVTGLGELYRPQGFNIGMNVGRAAGAGIDDHVHLHVVPRWMGDNNFVPVLSETRVIPEALEVTYRRLLPVFAGPEQEGSR